MSLQTDLQEIKDAVLEIKIKLEAVEIRQQELSQVFTLLQELLEGNNQ